MILFSQILTVAVMATIAMTIFSYLVSYLFKSNFKEPQLLNMLLNPNPMLKTSIYREHVIGWIIHFSIGLLFLIAFKILAHFFPLTLSLLTGFLFGLVAGVIGVCAWSLAFYLHPKPPVVNRSLFYIQLIAAHIIFGITMILLLRNY